ncbi:MAG: hypothetical protein IPN47_27845 [Gemmatimonadetes bacterium]|nr:hypothetical protein [Gemmatimonadota bacterium]
MRVIEGRPSYRCSLAPTTRLGLPCRRCRRSDSILRGQAFRVSRRGAARDTHPAAVLTRDGIAIGLAQNGGDPTQEGCFFEVDDSDAAFAELMANGAKPGTVDEQEINGQPYRAFFVVALDGLCFMIA